ncbi:MAG: AAA-like domain-containing protein [Anaerolineae bacterium]|nr:AAA-like domain-containing protein [Anaerolineae bacterium]
MKKPVRRHYQLENIRTLLTDGFTEGDLRAFCYDQPRLRPVYYQLAEGMAKTQIIHRLIEYADQHELLEFLLDWAEKNNPAKYKRYHPYFFDRPEEKPVRIFICYNPHHTPDHHLADYLDQFLSQQQYQVFSYFKLQPGQTWLEEIDRQIEASDFLIVLLSTESANSEMVQVEVRRANEYHKLQRRPQLLPVRVMEGALPYPLDALLDPFQYVTWRSKADNQRLEQDLLKALTGQLPRQEPYRARPVNDQSIISEDGTPVPDEQSWPSPLPSFNSRLLDELEAPGGTVKLRDKFYIERDADDHLKRQTGKTGTLTIIQAARQQGKSSLLVRGVSHARQNKTKTVSLDLQRVDSQYLADPALFLNYLAESIIRKLRCNETEAERFWRDSALGPQEKLTYLLEEYILPTSDNPILLAIDEADRLLQTAFHPNFFGMLRSWHNSAALGEPWEKLNLLLAISTEPYLLIPAGQSPFNVGLKLNLDDFNETQMHDLNWRHGSPVKDKNFSAMMALLNGHPYLSRKAFYTIATEHLTWNNLMQIAAKEDGPFGDHLRHQQWLLHAETDLKSALKEIIQHNRCHNKEALFRLLRAGLVRYEGEYCTCRCDLYRLYFADRL